MTMKLQSCYQLTLATQTGLGNEVEIAVQRRTIVIHPVSRPRSGWAEQFQATAKHRDDQLLDKPVPTKWDRSEWVW